MFLPHFLSFLLPPFLPASSSTFSLSLSWSKGESPASGICKGSLVSLKHQVHFRQSFSGVFSSCIPSHFCAGPPLSEKTLLSSSFHPVLTFQLDKKADTALTPRSHLKKTCQLGRSYRDIWAGGESCRSQHTADVHQDAEARQAPHVPLPPLICVLGAHHEGLKPLWGVVCSQGLEQELRHPDPGSTIN